MLYWYKIAVPKGPGEKKRWYWLDEDLFVDSGTVQFRSFCYGDSTPFHDLLVKSRDMSTIRCSDEPQVRCHCIQIRREKLVGDVFFDLLKVVWRETNQRLTR